MTNGLKYELAAGVTATGSYTSGGTFTFTPTSCSTGGSCMMNGNTVMQTHGDGYYYNQLAATAGSMASASGDSPGSICPNGWRLPGVVAMSGSAGNKSFYNLIVTAYGVSTATALQVMPLNFVVTRSYSGGTFQPADARGFYWNSPYASFMLFGSESGINTQHGDAGVLPSGLNVRCVNI